MKLIANYLDNFRLRRLITLSLILGMKKKQGRGDAEEDYRVRVLP